MSNTKDKIEDGKFNRYEKSDPINLFRHIDNNQNEMYKNTIESYIDGYNLIHLEDKVYLGLISDLNMYRDLIAVEFTNISKDNISQEERDSRLNYIKSELEPRKKETQFEIDIRRSKINSDIKYYVKESDEKKTHEKNDILGFNLNTAVVILATDPRTIEMIINGGKKLANVAIKKYTKLL